ncbi:MAG: CBS domain-containing protein [Bacteroidota bacterium]
MGEQRVSLLSDAESMQRFVRNLLKDVHSFEYMLKEGWFEDDIIRIGAEQEMFLVNKDDFRPAPIAMEVLESMNEPWVETELARFNLETNLTPRVFAGDCLSLLEKENRRNMESIRLALEKFDAYPLLTGVLPTLQKFDLEMKNLTPKKRYKALMEAINSQLIGNAYELRLMGIDEILVRHYSPLMEACNTSFQVHLQVTPQSFVKMYNIAQALAAPLIAISANSPIVFGKRLWHESRIALFQQALDVRTTHEYMRERSPRVSFGSGWLDKSIMEIYKEDIARFRVLLSADIEEDSQAMIQEGKVPKLRALQVHNSTVYRWNRPCYGISDNGKPHLRIENRVLAAGPTVLDEVANAALWLGAMVGMADQVEDVRDHIGWADVRDNFGKAARYGIDTNFTWFKDKKISACDLVLNELLPLARKGLELRRVNPEDIDRYLGVIEERAKAHANGARWQLRAFTKLREQVSRDEAVSALTSCIYKNQIKELPVHKWKMPTPASLEDYKPSKLSVQEFMETDLFTVQKDDIIELVAELMNWRKIRHMPVEDSKGRLSGLITSRQLLAHFNNEHLTEHGNNAIMAKDIMIKSPITIDPDESIINAMHMMRKHKIGCLPVVKGEELIGIITEMDFLRISSRLIERLEEEE